MKRLIRWYVVYLFVLFAPTINAQQIPDLAGEYTVAGETAKGRYTATAVIYQKDRAVFVQWQSAQGDVLQGLGIIRGDLVAVAYAAQDIGVAVVYKIEKDKLVGEWPSGDGRIWPETLMRGSARTQARVGQ